MTETKLLERKTSATSLQNARAVIDDRTEFSGRRERWADGFVTSAGVHVPIFVPPESPETDRHPMLQGFRR
jgi:hypothetical protein